MPNFWDHLYHIKTYVNRIKTVIKARFSSVFTINLAKVVQWSETVVV